MKTPMYGTFPIVYPAAAAYFDCRQPAPSKTNDATAPSGFMPTSTSKMRLCLDLTASWSSKSSQQRWS